MHSDSFGSRPGFRYIPDPLGRLNKGHFVRQRDLHDPFGRLMAEPKPEPEISNFRNPLRIRDSVGMEGLNSRRDVAKVENLLGQAGALDLAKTDGVTGFFGARADEAVRKFQKDRGLKVDGLINPNGPTFRTLIAGGGQRGNSAGLPGRTPGIAPKQENPLSPFSEQPTPDPRRETVKPLDLATTDGVTGFFGARVDEAVRKFQKDRGLKVDGLINPNGPTFRTLIAGGGQRGNSAGLPGRTPGIAPKQENPLPSFSEQPTPDPRRETVKRLAGRLLEIKRPASTPGPNSWPGSLPRRGPTAVMGKKVVRDRNSLRPRTRSPATRRPINRNPPKQATGPKDGKDRAKLPHPPVSDRGIDPSIWPGAG